MLRFWKVTSESLKNRETFRYLSNFKFSGLFVMKFYAKSIWFKIKTFFFEGVYHKKPRRGNKNTPRVNQGLESS